MNCLKEIRALVLFIIILVFSSSCETSIKYKDLPVRPILESDILTFQKSYSDSFNAITKAIEDNTYYETAAKDHINQHYNFDEGKVMFKIGHNVNEPYRYTFKGVLSYLIGKNKTFPNDQGIAKENWKKIQWINEGIINDSKNIAVVMGKVKMTKDNNDNIMQNFTMCLKRDNNGEIKIIVHKIAKPCS